MPQAYSSCCARRSKLRSAAGLRARQGPPGKICRRPGCAWLALDSRARMCLCQHACGAIASEPRLANSGTRPVGRNTMKYTLTHSLHTHTQHAVQLEYMPVARLPRNRQNAGRLQSRAHDGPGTARHGASHGLWPNAHAGPGTVLSQLQKKANNQLIEEHADQAIACRHSTRQQPMSG